MVCNYILPVKEKKDNVLLTLREFEQVCLKPFFFGGAKKNKFRFVNGVSKRIVVFLQSRVPYKPLRGFRYKKNARLKEGLPSVSNGKIVYWCIKTFHLCL